MSLLSERLSELKGTLPSGITIVAASKTQSIDKIFELNALDDSIIFGENRVQELLEKYTPKLKWHLIGQLQTNKVKYIVDKVEMIESLDRKSLALEIEKQALKFNKIMPCLLEVNIGGEETKGGLSPLEVPEFLKWAKSLSHIKIEGLMTVAPIATEEKLKIYFEQMKTLYDKFKDEYDFKFLSMGMSSDFKLAIECGSNLIRPGRALFGERNYNV